MSQEQDRYLGSFISNSGGIVGATAYPEKGGTVIVKKGKIRKKLANEDTLN